MIDRQRFVRRFEEMSAISRTPRGGVHRPALTDQDRACRDLLRHWCEEAGLKVHVDKIGSMFATLRGRDEAAAPFLVGSHLDSQPYAGAYDGPLGVLAALEIIESMIDAGEQPAIPLQLVNWTNEEGARFRPPLVASAVFAGALELTDALDCADIEGKTIGEELKRIDYAGDVRPGWPIRGYIELHIEQGTVLETVEAPIGVVTGGVGLKDLRVTVLGEDTHAGPFAMSERRDALLGAAKMIVAANDLGLDEGPEARVTVGRIHVPSDSHSVVPGRAEFTLDLRHPQTDGLDRLEDQARRRFGDIAQQSGLTVDYDMLWAYPPFDFDPQMRSAVSAAAADLGHRSRELPSRAGHDAWNMAKIAPSALVFIPCRDGKSHNEQEFASTDHMIAGVEVLQHVVRAITDGA